MGPKKAALTYKGASSKQDSFRILKAIAIPLMVFALQIFTVNNFAAFGTKLISPASAAMWIVGFVAALFMPGDRDEIIKQTLSMCTIYCLALLGLKIALAVVSGASSEMIAASYNQAIPTTTGNTIPGYVQNILWFTAVGVPIAHITMQGKRLFTFTRNKSIQEAYSRVRNISNNGKEPTNGIG